MFGNTEYELLCEACNHTWYVTKRDIRQAKRNRRHARSLKIQSYSLHTLKTYNRINSQLAMIEAAGTDPLRCPACMSRRVFKTRV